MFRLRAHPAALVVVVVFAARAACVAPPIDGSSAKVRAEVRALIDRFAEVAEGDIGYSASINGPVFLPLDTATKPGHLGKILGARALTRSDAMRRLVQLGPYAMPELIAHLGDRRKTGIQVRVGMPWDQPEYYYGEEFDYNARTDPPPKFGPKKGATELGGETSATDALCVGDLCFVAIGQIVNRDFSAMRFQPSMVVVVNAPTQAPLLRENVTRVWAGLTRARHKAALVADFLNPDSASRRSGACRRLAYYYPETLDNLVLPFLARPAYSVIGARTFVRDRLYVETGPRKRRQLFDDYIKSQGESARGGILEQLFDDLDMLEADEEKRLVPGGTKFGTTPRDLLIQLFGKPKTVRSKDRPAYGVALSDADKYSFINEALLDDESPAIDRAVRDLLVGDKDDWVATACVARLIGRGYDREIEAWCRKTLAVSKDKDYRDEAEGFRARLGWTRLHAAAERGNAERIRRLLWDRPRLGAASRDGSTALHVAAGAGRDEAVRVLVEAGAAIDARDTKGRTPTQLAAEADHYEVVEYLAGHGAHLPDVLSAAVVGRADLVDKLIRRDSGSLKARSRAGQSPLHLAVAGGHERTVAVLLARGAATEAKNEAGWTPLRLAAAHCRVAAVRELLARKADVSAALEYDSMQPLHLACVSGNVEIVRLLLDAGAKIDVPSNGHWASQPLHLAAQYGHARVVTLLLLRGANPRALDGEGQTPLHLAARHNRASATARLVAAGTPFDVKGNGERTPLDVAVEYGQLPVLLVLLPRDATAARRDAISRPLLHWARNQEDTDVIRLLQAWRNRR